jgi:hypothetical protein
MERKTWFYFPVEYDSENLFSPWSKILDCAAHQSYGFGRRREPLVTSYPVVNKRISTNPIRIQIPNRSIIESTHKADLDVPMLRPAARWAHIVPELHNCSLLSIGTFCDAN